MTSPSGIPYQATAPPDGAACDGNMCRTRAVVALIIPRPGGDGASTGVWNLCDLCWPSFRWACEQSGHAVVDTTGSLRQTQDQFPRWNVWTSDRGRLYAATYVNGPDGPHGITVDALLIGPLWEQMAKIEAGMRSKVAVP